MMLLMIQSIFSYLNKEKNHQIILFFLPVHIFNNRMFLVCVQEDENHGIVQRYRRSVFLFHKITKSAMVKCKLHPGLKQLNCTGNRTSALCKHLHSQDANTKLAKNPE